MEIAKLIIHLLLELKMGRGKLGNGAYVPLHEQEKNKGNSCFVLTHSENPDTESHGRTAGATWRHIP